LKVTSNTNGDGDVTHLPRKTKENGISHQEFTDNKPYVAMIPE
jgi:hypothetical protein